MRQCEDCLGIAQGTEFAWRVNRNERTLKHKDVGRENLLSLMLPLGRIGFVVYMAVDFQRHVSD